jgi:hypothetical protein
MKIAIPRLNLGDFNDITDETIEVFAKLRMEIFESNWYYQRLCGLDLEIRLYKEDFIANPEYTLTLIYKKSVNDISPVATIKEKHSGEVEENMWLNMLYKMKNLIVKTSIQKICNE